MRLNNQRKGQGSLKSDLFANHQSNPLLMEIIILNCVKLGFEKTLIFIDSFLAAFPRGVTTILTLSARLMPCHFVPK